MKNLSKKYCDNKATGGVSLWDLITFLPFFFVLGGTFAYIKMAGLKGIHLLIPLAVGMIMGVICVKVIRLIGNVSVMFIERHFINSELIYKVLYLFAFLWIFISEALSYQIVKFMVEAVKLPWFKLW
jgi:hypothetical protein